MKIIWITKLEGATNEEAEVAMERATHPIEEVEVLLIKAKSKALIRTTQDLV
jgi:hypothetical protein